MKKKKSRRGRIALIILAVVLLLLAALVWWQWDNVKAIYLAFFNSQEEIEAKLQQNDQAIKEAVEKTGANVRQPTEDEREALRNGTLTPEELAQRLQQEYVPLQPPPKEPDPPEVSVEPDPPSLPQEPVTPTEPDPPVEPAVPQEPEKPDPEAEYQSQLNDILARVYVLREEYVMELDAMQKEATAAFNKMGDNKDGLTTFISNYLSEAVALEKECDKKMDAILAELEVLLKKYNKSTELVGTVAYTYANEKSLKKAWYMNELQRRGLI